MNYFITGTDTGVGKTFVSSLLIRSLRAAGLDTVGMKPICCGERDDAAQLHAAADFAIPLDDVNPVWLRTPASPYTAAKVENRVIDLALIRERLTRLRRTHRSLIVEGAGGWEVPVTRDFSMADLAAESGLPVLIVVGNRLGAINHTLLTAQAIRARGLTFAGVILNNHAPESRLVTVTNRSTLETFLDAPILFEIEKGQTKLPLSVV